MNTNHILLASAWAASIGLSAFAGYKYAEKRLNKELETVLDEEIQATKNLYAKLNKDGMDTPQEAVAKLAPEVEVEDTKVAAANAMSTYKGQNVELTPNGIVEIVKDPLEIEVILDVEEEHNIFVNGVPIVQSMYDSEEEALARKNGVPYVVSVQEYDENPDDHEQVVLTWFEVDNTLVDEDEKVIDDVENTVGSANMYKFGHGSNDSEVVYVRNESRQADYEVTRSQFSYQESVLGLTLDDDGPTLEHSSRRNTRRLGD